MTIAPEMTKTIEAVRSEAAGLGDFLTGMDADDWNRNSACAEWKVGDVVAHLAQGGHGWIEFIARALEGDIDPPPGQQTLRAGDRGSEATAQRAVQQRQSQGEQELLDSFNSGYQQLYELLQQLKPEDWELPCFHRRGLSSIQEMVARRVQELAIHGWDIRSAFDPSHQLSEPAVGVVVGLVRRWLTSTFTPKAHGHAPVRYRFNISGPTPVLEDIVVYRDRFEVGTPGGGSADVTFTGPGSDYLLLIYGRLRFTGEDDSGDLEIDGSIQQAALFNTWFRGV